MATASPQLTPQSRVTALPSQRQHRAGGVIHGILTDFRILPDGEFASRRWPTTQSGRRLRRRELCVWGRAERQGLLGVRRHCEVSGHEQRERAGKKGEHAHSSARWLVGNPRCSHTIQAIAQLRQNMRADFPFSVPLSLTPIARTPQPLDILKSSRS